MPLEGLKLRGDSGPGLLDRARNERLAPRWGLSWRRGGHGRGGYWRCAGIGFGWLRFDGAGQIPAGIGGMRALQDGEGRFQPDGRRGADILEQVVESVHRAGGQLAQPVIQFVGVFGPRSLDGDFECRLGADPMMDGGAVDAGIFGRGGDGLPSSQGLDDLSLSGRQVGI